MARPVCDTCRRPLKVCLCNWVEPVANRVEIAILQHPSEVDQVKGTARIAELSLERCRLWVGERFEDEPGLQEWLSSDEVFLLYPPTDNSADRQPVPVYRASEVAEQYAPDHIKVLVLDGTWRKAYRMLMENPVLQDLRRIELQPARASGYCIRKQKNAGSLSTLEAIYQVLIGLEGEAERFQPLLNAFESMVSQQQSFRKPS